MKNYAYCLLVISVLFLVACGSEAKKVAWKDDAPRRLELLFLGHEQEHHNARAYFPMLASALTKDGINLTYTEALEDINTKNLNLYDGIIIYANHETIATDQEKALLDYVADGHAFIPIHSASFCFKNSEAYIALVGAQFKEHGTGTFTATITQAEHPTVSGLSEFSTWDETYVHAKIAADINVVMERVDGDHREPWTWVKEHGKGKVFYTAYGHDERTWEQPSFQKLIKQGILWAVGATPKKNWEAFMVAMPALSYEKREGIPNYENRPEPLPYQLPLSPAASAKHIQVPAGFRLELFASEPDIINPIDMHWDEKGRLWVIETVDYPNTVRDEKGEGDDRIKILEDTNGDGKADKVTVFADKLNIPTSFTFYNGGIVVSQAPHFLFLKDTDGDDKADVKDILIDGWGTFDTHAGPSNLQLGIDNALYGVVGYSGFEGSIFGQEFKFNQNVYRFKPKSNYFEVLTNTSNNTWGLGFTEDNSLFASTANNTHSVYVGIANKYIENVRGIPAQGSTKIDGHYAMQPLTPNIRQVDVFGGFTAAAGHHFYTARTYPSNYWNQIAFVCEPTGGVVHMAKIEQNGAGYVEKDGGNLFASSDEWVSPVAAKVGPDGVVWVADWYNFIVQHNPTPSANRGGFDAENGKGNAYVNPLRDKANGRIWRVVPKNMEAQTPLQLNTEDTGALLQALSHDNMFWRSTAQRLLVSRDKTDVLPNLYKLAQETTINSDGNSPIALHALWTIDGLVHLEQNQEAYEIVKGSLYHPAAAVRKAAIAMLPKTKETNDAILQAKLLEDNDPKVQLQALLYIAEMPATANIGAILHELSSQATFTRDPWLSKAVYAAASKHSATFMAAYAAANPSVEINIPNKPQRQEENYNDTSWQTMNIPQYIEDAGLQIDGIIWFRKAFDFFSPQEAKLSLGAIDDSDIVFINGIQVGATDNDYQKQRQYTIPKGVLKPSGNVIAVKVIDTGGGGGLYGPKENIMIRSGAKNLDLSGDWKYEVEIDFDKGAGNPFSEKGIAEVFAANYGNEVGDTSTAQNSANTNTRQIVIKTVQNEMKYDGTTFTVTAGETIELVLDNIDFMQHNLIIVSPGSKDKVGAAADKMAMATNGAELHYIPKMDEVLVATPLVNPEQKVSVRFTVPSTPGEYPYICTFPGHWRIMQGVMIVKAAKIENPAK